MAVSDDYQDTLERLAALTAAQVQGETDTAVIVALLNRARASAVATADVYTARQLEVLTDRVVTPAGVLPTDESERLTEALETIGDTDVAMRLERLARSEVFAAAQSTVSESLSKMPDRPRQFVGWVRQLEAGHCDRCERWAKNGRVWPKNHKMATHPNCNCVQCIVISDTKPLPVRSKRRGRRK
jgi:hypothetical protein